MSEPDDRPPDVPDPAGAGRAQPDPTAPSAATAGPGDPPLDRQLVTHWVSASSGREGTFWPGLTAAGVALVIAAVLWPSAPRWSMWAVGWTALVVVIWVACVLVDRPPGRRPRLDPQEYRQGDLPGQMLAATRADQVEFHLMLLRSARSAEAGRQIAAEEVPAMRAPWPVHRLGRSWHACDPPPTRHPCWPQTIAIRLDDGTAIERCPCGAVRRRRIGSPWRHRNERVVPARRAGVRAPRRGSVQPDR